MSLSGQDAESINEHENLRKMSDHIKDPSTLRKLLQEYRLRKNDNNNNESPDEDHSPGIFL